MSRDHSELSSRSQVVFAETIRLITMTPKVAMIETAALSHSTPTSSDTVSSTQKTNSVVEPGEQEPACQTWVLMPKMIQIGEDQVEQVARDHQDVADVAAQQNVIAGDGLREQQFDAPRLEHRGNQARRREHRQAHADASR